MYGSAKGKGTHRLVKRAVERQAGSKLPGVVWLLLLYELAEFRKGGTRRWGEDWYKAVS